MQATTIQKMQEAGLAHLKAGRVAEAAAVFQHIVELYPNDPRAPFTLSVICQQSGRLSAALDWARRASSIDPRIADPWFITGLIHYQQRQLPAAVAAYEKFLQLKPNDGKGLNNLGRALLDLGDCGRALQALQHAVAAVPTNASAFCNLGDALRACGKPGEANDAYRRAVAIDPKMAEAHSSLGTFLVQCGQIGEGIASLQHAISLNPRLYSARFNLSRALQDAGLMEAALVQCRAAVEIRPESPDAQNLLGNLLGIAGEIEGCIAAQRRAVELKPDHAAAHSNLLLSLHYRDDLSAEEMFTAHQQWAQQHACGFGGETGRGRSVVPSIGSVLPRRLRVGFVSPNFMTHSVAYFFEPVLKSHDRAALEIFCYSDAAPPDQTTQRIEAAAEHWRQIAGQSDEKVAELIRGDAVDVLIDLAGHTAGNRMLVFARRPAPVQMTWIGYPDTTGLAAMDYRITDAIADPPGQSDRLHTEKLIRIEGGCWAYAAPPAPPPAAPPAITNGFVTFGSFNNLPKVSPKVIAAWGRILQKVPGSRMMLKAVGLGTPTGKEFVLSHFVRADISADRIELLGWLPSTASHLEHYQRVDIALDTFPYNGTTTTCEALWMGVPVVTFRGSNHAGRVGASLLTTVGFPEWVAEGVDGYVETARNLAVDVDRLAQVRRSLRGRMSASPLCDPLRMARELEQALRLGVGWAAEQP
jgi:predicted O-linked N-acetylglucosamine transferase (SPINDLY family)